MKHDFPLINRHWIRDIEQLEKLILKKIEDSISEVGVMLSIEEVSIYGSSVSNKESPNDIDVLIEISNVEDLIGETDDVEYLTEKINDALHINQPLFHSLPLDIQVTCSSFEESDLYGSAVKISAIKAWVHQEKRCDFEP